jgi:plastocyanin
MATVKSHADGQTTLGRRTLLRSLAIASVTLAVSACGSSSHKSATTTTTSGQTTSAAQTSSPSASATRVVGAASLPKPLSTSSGPPPTVVGRDVASTAVATATSAADTVDVTITPNLSFSPATVTIHRGQTVSWTNTGRSPQTVTDDPLHSANPNNAQLPAGAKEFDSGVLNHGEVYSRAFNTPGEYVYFSVPGENKGMIGKVVVQ